MRHLVFICFMLATALAAPQRTAQAQVQARADGAAASAASAAESPRQAVAAFLSECRLGRYAAAARYLDVPDELRPRAGELARRLKAVLDRYLWIDLNGVSDLAGGNPEDGLASDVDELGSISIPDHAEGSVRMARVGEGSWAFARTTVTQIDTWYDAVPNRWALEHFPPFLLKPGPWELMWWQWLALPLLVVVAWSLGFALSRLTRGVLVRIALRTQTRWDDAAIERAGAPLSLLWMTAVAAIGVSSLSLYAPAEALFQRGLRIAFLVAVFWMLSRCIQVAELVISSSAWATAGTAASLVRLGARLAQAGVFVLAVVALLSAWGYSVASLLAGLGIGGVAVALAAQKTVENLFGAFSIGVDQPFREGDFVKIEDFVGTVERIGLRSTRIRTLDRTLISLPNGKLADMRLESFTARDRIRLYCRIGLVYETTGAQMHEVLAGFEQLLRAHPKIWPDAVVVRFVGFGEHSLDIDVMAWFLTKDWNEFQGIRQDLFLEFMAIVEAAGTRFALPTRTLHLTQPESGQPTRPRLRPVSS